MGHFITFTHITPSLCIGRSEITISTATFAANRKNITTGRDVAVRMKNSGINHSAASEKKILNRKPISSLSESYVNSNWCPCHLLLSFRGLVNFMTRFTADARKKNHTMEQWKNAVH